MAYNQKMISLKKWIFLIIFAFLILVIQSTEILTLSYKVKPALLFTFATSAALFLKKEEVPIIAMICGLFLDCFSTTIFGVSAVILLIFCTIINIFIKKYIQTLIVNVILVNFLFFLIYCLTIFILQYPSFEKQDIFSVWLLDMLPHILYTTFSSVFMFLLVKKICHNSKIHIDEKQDKSTKSKRKKYAR